jgi:CO/xanthine dehydrogenase FAD-binding subunit
LIGGRVVLRLIRTRTIDLDRRNRMYFRPSSIEDALAALARRRPTILAGGTDFYPVRVGRPLPDDVLDVTALDALRGIDDRGEHVRIGAAVRWSEIAEAALPRWFDCLKLAAREIGGRQIQNAGTLVGNVCNASPAADGVPCLLALDAAVELDSTVGTRRLAIADFIRGNRVTARRPDELVTAIIVPKPCIGARSTFLKLGARRYLVISIAMVAALVATAPDGTIEEARIAVGACSVVALRLATLEADLRGRPLVPGIGKAVVPEHLAALSPIDDVRGAAAYRRDAARSIVARALEQLAAEVG